jgi:integrase
MNLLKAKATAKLLRHGTAGRYFDGAGLYLVISSPTAAYWERRYELNGKAHQMGLGKARDFTLAEARERNRRISQLLADGIDPLAQRAAERAATKAAALKAMTFAEAAQNFFAQHEGKWRNRKHRAQFISSLREYAFPVIGDQPMAVIDTPLVLRVLERKIAAERGYPAGRFWDARPETASRVRGRIENVLDWATARGFRSGDNPASWKTIGKVLPSPGKIKKVEHHAALPYAELPAFMAALGEREGSAAVALAFTILTAARTGEVIGARWSEVDLKTAIWTVPAGRMKASREHRVPLTPAALDLLKALPTADGNDFIFIGPNLNGLSNAAMSALLDRMGRADLTVHGFRSTFRDWAAETTAFPGDVIEMSLAHTIKNKTEAAYRRGDLLDKRRKLMEAWAKFATAPPVAAKAKVVPMRGRR